MQKRHAGIDQLQNLPPFRGRFLPVGQSGGHVQQMQHPHRTLRRHRDAVFHHLRPGKTGQNLGNRHIQIQHSPLHQNHGRHGCNGLGHGEKPENVVSSQRFLFPDVRVAAGAEKQLFAVFSHQQADARRLLILYGLFHQTANPFLKIVIHHNCALTAGKWQSRSDNEPMTCTGSFIVGVGTFVPAP